MRSLDVHPPERLDEPDTIVHHGFQHFPAPFLRAKSGFQSAEAPGIDRGPDIPDDLHRGIAEPDLIQMSIAEFCGQMIDLGRNQLVIPDQAVVDGTDHGDFLRISMPRGPLGIESRSQAPPVDLGAESASPKRFKPNLIQGRIIAPMSVEEQESAGPVLHEILDNTPHDAGKPLKPNVDGPREIRMMAATPKGMVGTTSAPVFASIRSARC